MNFECPRCLVRPLAGALLGAWLALPAGAAVTLYTGADVGGFVPDTATTEFCSAIGGELSKGGCAGTAREFTTFDRDIDGELFDPDTLVAGDRVAPFALLSSPDAVDVEYVLTTAGDPGTSRLGPAPGFVGTLEIEFLADGASAVGLGPVSLGTNATITFYDAADGELLSTTDASNLGFTFVGVTATEDDLIRRVVIEGTGPYALQDLQYVLVPEPGAWLQAAFAVAVLGACRRRAGRS